MSAQSTNPLEMVVAIRDHDHFEAMNDFICFQRSKVKNFTWNHGYLGGPPCSCLTIEFHNATDALMFKLTYG